ncbi:helix-turn-helix domain-containing protein [Enterococcus rotai]|uniref:helix-turn-helix domain-containing protein n=1 Tax=Enterococcus rotai TaxID=118060 RepID=UPI0032B53B91
MRAFLDETYDKQLKILSYIDDKKNIVTIKQIADSTKLSEKTVLQTIRKFEQEFSHSESHFQIIYSNKSIKGIYAENLDLIEISSGYMKKSVLYKMIRNIFLYEKVEVKKFCDLEYISPPTFSRYRQRLATILNKFGLKLSRDNQIHGEELKIRNFFYLFFFHSSSEWEFTIQEYAEIETYLYREIPSWHTNNKIRQRKICLLIYISNVRASQKHYYENKTMTKLSKCANDEYGNDFEYLDGVFDYFFSKKNRTIEQVWNELSFVQLFLYKESLNNEKIDYDQYENYFNIQNFSFIEQSNLLTKKIIQTFFSEVNTDSRKLYLQIRQEIDKLHIAVSSFYINPHFFYYVYDSANFYYHDDAEIKIVEQVNKIVAELIEEPSYKLFWNQLNKNISKEEFVNELYPIVYTLLHAFQQYSYKKVKVMIQNSKIYMEGIISNKLMLIFGDRIQLVKDFRNTPDILITDMHVSDKPKPTKEIFVSSFSDFIDFNNAVDGIKNEIIKKYNQREFKREIMTV